MFRFATKNSIHKVVVIRGYAKDLKFGPDGRKAEGAKSFSNAVASSKANGLNFTPFFDRVLVERLAPEAKTKGGILIPEKAQGKVLEATVVAAGPGARANDGKIVPTQVKVGDRVLLPEYGGSKVLIDEKEYQIFRESDIMGKFN